MAGASSGAGELGLRSRSSDGADSVRGRCVSACACHGTKERPVEAVILRFARGRLLTARLVVMTLDKKHPKSEKMRRTDLSSCGLLFIADCQMRQSASTVQSPTRRLHTRRLHRNSAAPPQQALAKHKDQSPVHRCRHQSPLPLAPRRAPYFIGSVSVTCRRTRLPPLLSHCIPPYPHRFLASLPG